MPEPSLPRVGSGRRAIGALLVLASLVGVAGIVPAHVSALSPTTVLSVFQTPGVITEHARMSVYLEVADSSNIRQVYFTFCQLTSSLCYQPVVMAPQGANWFEGSTLPMANYYGMNVGVRAGYNITIVYTDNSTSSCPQMPNSFANLTVAQTVTGEFVYAMAVSPLLFALSGHVYSAATGAGVAGATVTLSPGNGTSTVTDARGAYAFAGLLNGTYSLTISMSGFSTSRGSVTIAGGNAVQDFSLSSGSGAPGGGGGGGSAGFLTTPTGLGVIGGLAAAVILGALLLLRRGRANRHSPPGGSGSVEGGEGDPRRAP